MTTTIEDNFLFNIEDYIGGEWVLRYRQWLTLAEAEEKYEWLTTSDYWLNIAPNYRIVKLSYTLEEVKRYKLLVDVEVENGSTGKGR